MYPLTGASAGNESGPFQFIGHFVLISYGIVRKNCPSRELRGFMQRSRQELQLARASSGTLRRHSVVGTSSAVGNSARNWWRSNMGASDWLSQNFWPLAVSFLLFLGQVIQYLGSQSIPLRFLSDVQDVASWPTSIRYTATRITIAI